MGRQRREEGDRGRDGSKRSSMPQSPSQHNGGTSAEAVTMLCQLARAASEKVGKALQLH